MPEPIRAHISANRPLLRAGLERLATGAGIQIVDDQLDAELGLRCDTTIGNAREAPHAITIHVGDLVIECGQSPAEAVWARIRELVVNANV